MGASVLALKNAIELDTDTNVLEVQPPPPPRYSTTNSISIPSRSFSDSLSYKDSNVATSISSLNSAHHLPPPDGVLENNDYLRNSFPLSNSNVTSSTKPKSNNSYISQLQQHTMNNSNPSSSSHFTNYPMPNYVSNNLPKMSNTSNRDRQR